MNHVKDISMNISIGLALLIFMVYFVYVGMIKKKATAVGVKRVWLINGVIVASVGLIIGNTISDKIFLFCFVFPFFLIPGHLKMFPQIKENRRPISSGKNIWEKILIFFWY